MLNIQGMSVDSWSNSLWKVEFLRDLLKSKGNIPILAITETWLKSHVSRAQISIPGYNVHRCDRASRTRGGVLTYIHEDICVGETSTFDNTFCEVVISCLDKAKTAVITLYRPPRCPFPKFKEAMYFVENFVNSLNDHWTYLINGDFNCPNIDWENICVNSGLPSDDISSAKYLLSFLDKYGMGQFVNTPTRKENDTENILDLLITNIGEVILDVKSEHTMLSDHNLLTVSLGSNLLPSNKVDPFRKRPFSFSCFDFCKADFERISSYIENVDWKNIFENDPDSFSKHFISIITNICHLCVPLKKGFFDEKPKRKKGTFGIRSLKRKQKRLKTRLKALEILNPASTRILSLKLSLENIENQIKSRLSLSRQKEEKEAVAAIKKNPHFFYSFAKKHSKVSILLVTLLVI